MESFEDDILKIDTKDQFAFKTLQRAISAGVNLETYERRSINADDVIRYDVEFIHQGCLLVITLKRQRWEEKTPEVIRDAILSEIKTFDALVARGGFWRRNEYISKAVDRKYESEIVEAYMELGMSGLNAVKGKYIGDLLRSDIGFEQAYSKAIEDAWEVIKKAAMG